jgi:hypothetical protein
MRGSWTCLAVVLVIGAAPFSRVAASEPDRAGVMVWIQPAFGLATGDGMVTGTFPANVSMTDIPLIGSVSTSLPLTADLELEDPVGVLFGGEVTFRRVGVEMNCIYVHKAATARGGVKVRGGLLSEEESDLLEILGITVPDLMIVEGDIENLALTLGVNYHFVDGGRWKVWAGPIVVWTAWGIYDLSDARIELEQSLEELLQGSISGFELVDDTPLAPQNALSFGVGIGGSYDVAGGWSVIGSVRYFIGDEIGLPGDSGSYGVASFSLGVARSFGR